MFLFSSDKSNKDDNKSDDINNGSSTKKENIEEENWLQYTLDISTHFQLPINYIKTKSELKNEIVKDLELVETIDETCEPIYQTTFSPSTEAGRIILREFPRQYTTNIEYLKDTQRLLKEYNIDDVKDHEKVNEAIRVWKEIKGDLGFKSKYHYIEWSYWKNYNYSEAVLQFISMYSLASPFLALLVPFIILIVPLFILKARGIDVTMNEYMQILKVVASNHAICRLFTSFKEVDVQQKIYLLFSTAIYLFSMYQNVLTCLRFYNNMKKIHHELLFMREYIDITISEMDKFLSCSSKLNHYEDFNKTLIENKENLAKFKTTLDMINSQQISLKNLGQIGMLMKHFYTLYDSNECNTMFLYSFGFHGFIENMRGLIYNIQDKRIGYSTFNKKKKTVFKKAYYASHIHSDKTENDIKLNKSMIITGPNASGKTTTLKTTLINILITQQFGCGYYKSGNLTPFEHIHCYLNIPDTSGRDSLFQAEARRCKDIIDIIQTNKKERHFCVFDELYSGTNPEEAVLSATAFMRYLIRNKDVKCILTTHYISICDELSKHKEIQNYKMNTEVTDSKEGTSFNYTYLLKPGISIVKGGLKVLSDMNYPEEIIHNTRESE